MTTRERRMSIVLIGFILVVGVGFFGYQLVLAPLKAQTDQINRLDEEIGDREARIARVMKRRTDEEKWKKLSLPADQEKKGSEAANVGPGKSPAENAHADLAQREYQDELTRMLKAAGYSDADVGIIPKRPDAKNSPALANKKPIYTKLVFTVQMKGDMASLVDFMERFYKLRLLHQIRNMTIQKPIGAELRAAVPVAPPAGNGAPGGNPAPAPVNTPSTDLDVSLTIEALVLDTAEQRKTLLPDKVDVPSLLARTDLQYAMIAGKNMFYGQAPTRTGPTDDRGSQYFDVTPFLYLTGITSGPNGLEAGLWDRFHNREYRITPRSLGGFQVETLFNLRGAKHADSSSKTLTMKDADGETRVEWQVVRIDAREVILRDEKTGKYFALHMGENVDSVKRAELSKSDLEALGIKPEPVKEAPKTVVPIDYANP